MEQFSKTSCLSDGVYHLICGLNLEYTISCKRESVEEKVLWMERRVIGNNHDDRIKYLNAVATFSLAKNPDGIKFVNTIKQLIPFCHEVHKHLMQLTNEEFEEKFGMDLDWTGCKERIVECFQLLKIADQEPLNVVISSLLLFSMLERSLGDIYVSHTGSKCPSNLKDMLMSKGIQELLGEDVCSILYAFAGPPEGLNLRNVLWHGFVSVGEIPPQFISFLLFTVITISSRFCSIQIERRPKLSLMQSNVPCIFPNIESSQCISSIDQLFTTSLFMTSSMLPVWKKALQCYKEQRHDLVVVLLLPLLEQALRRAFAYANKCPKRILTAESTTLYTTFDEILAPSLHDGSDNQLRKEIGDEHLQMLLDILVYADGPRLRDRISHGEVDLDGIPSEMSNHVLCICVVFASHFTSKLKGNISIDMTRNLETAGKCLAVKATAKSSQINEKSSAACITDNLRGANCQSCTNISLSDNSDTIQEIILKARKYISIYHPTEILKKTIRDLAKVLDKWDQISSPETELTSTSSADPYQSETKEHTLKIIRMFCDDTNRSGLILNGVVIDGHELEVLVADGHFSRCICLLCEKVKIPTLYRPRKELELVSLFSSIVKHCSNASAQAMDTANQRFQQWSKKELRSRQRTNYKRLLSLLPFLHNVIEIILVFILVELHSLPANSAGDTKAGYVKFLKRCLQSSENLDSLSSSTKNRWDECKVIGEQLIQTIQTHFDHI